MFLSNMKDRGSVSVQFVRGDENHVEGDIGILHPHIDRQRHPEIEQHAGVGGQLFAALQALDRSEGVETIWTQNRWRFPSAARMSATSRSNGSAALAPAGVGIQCLHLNQSKRTMREGRLDD